MAWRNGRLATLGLALIGLSVSSLCAELYRYQDERGVTVVDWAIPAAYVTNGYEVLNETGQVVRVVQPAKTETELEQEAARTRVQAAEAAAEAAKLERDTFLLRRYSTVEDIEAARDRSLRELEIRIAILNGQRATLSDRLATHEAALAGRLAVADPADHYEEETIAALKAELKSLDEAVAGRRHQSAALKAAYARDIERFAELEDIVALRQQLSVPDTTP